VPLSLGATIEEESLAAGMGEITSLAVPEPPLTASARPTPWTRVLISRDRSRDEHIGI